MLLRAITRLSGPTGQSFERMLSAAGVVVARFDGERLPRGREAPPADLVLLDGRGAEASTLGSVGEARAHPDAPEVLVVVDREDARRRARLLAAGCFAVLDGSLGEEVLAPAVAGLIARLLPARERAALQRRREHLREEGWPEPRDAATRELLETAARVARADSSVLVLGETGVGKEWLARRIHAASARSQQPFVEVNCAALSEGLLESELFGHVEGAFTGAVRARRGFFELAHGGTLFLDEVGETSPALQSKLLRVLQDRMVRPVGGERAVEVDVRLIAATSRDLDAARSEERFRSDLYYRLAVVTLRVPPLRERPGDVADLLAFYLERFRRRLGRPGLRLSPAAVEVLAAYAWPGNVRELINVVERAAVLAKREEIGPDDLVADLGEPRAAWRGPDGGEIGSGVAADLVELPLKEARRRALTRFEREYIAAQLRAAGGRVGVAARRAGVGPRSLHGKMKRYDLRKEDFR